MGLLVGLPLRLFHIVFVLLRFLWPLAVLWLVRRLMLAVRRRREEGPAMHQAPKEPEFDGPVGRKGRGPSQGGNMIWSF